MAGPERFPDGEAEAVAAALALAWAMRHPLVMPIPKARNLAHLRENLAASCLALDALFPPASAAGDAPTRACVDNPGSSFPSS